MVVERAVRTYVGIHNVYDINILYPYTVFTVSHHNGLKLTCMHHKN
jgi:hypothetical protein